MDVAQCKMARAGLGWSAQELAQKSGVSVRSVMRFEAGEAIRRETVQAMAKALVTGGAMFADIEGKRGVLLSS